MKSKFGSIVISGCGKLAGHNFVKQRGYSILRSDPPHNSISTQKKQLAQNSFRLLSSAWRSLSQAQISLWNNFSSGSLSGFHLFKSCNANRLLLGQSVLTSPVQPSILNYPRLISAYYNSILNKLFISLSGYIPAGIILKVYATATKSPGVTNSRKSFKYLGTISTAGSSHFDITSLYFSVFPALRNSTQQIFVKICPVQTASGFSFYPSEASTAYPITLLFNTDQSPLSSITFSIYTTTGKLLYIDWGDGILTSIVGIGSAVAYTHVYSIPADSYTIRIFGDLSYLITFNCAKTNISSTLSQFYLCQRMSYLNFNGPSIYGTLNDLDQCPTINQLYIYGYSIAAGDVAHILKRSNLLNCYLYSSPLYTYSSCTPNLANNGTFRFQSNGWNSATVDQILIDMAKDDCTGKTLNIGGTNAARTSLSDAAKAKLLAQSWIITVNE